MECKYVVERVHQGCMSCDEYHFGRVKSMIIVQDCSKSNQGQSRWNDAPMLKVHEVPTTSV